MADIEGYAFLVGAGMAVPGMLLALMWVAATRATRPRCPPEEET